MDESYKYKVRNKCKCKMLPLFFLLVVYVSATVTQLQVLPLADRQSHFRVDLQADNDSVFFQDAVLCVGMQAPTEHTTCSSAGMFRCTLDTQAHGTRKTLVVGPLEDASEHAYYLLDTRLNTGEQCVKQLTINHAPLPEEKADKALVETNSVAENALSKDQEPWYYYSLVMVAAVAIVALLVAGVIVVWYNGHKNGPSLWSKGFMDAYAERRKQNRQLASESLNLLRPLEEI